MEDRKCQTGGPLGDRAGRIAVAVLILGLALALTSLLKPPPPVAGAIPTDDAIGGPAHDLLEGLSEGLSVIRLEDGFEMVTHGVDPPVAPLEVGAEASLLRSRSRRPRCARPGEPQLRVVYAESDKNPVRKAKRRIRTVVKRMNGMISAAGRRASKGRERIDLRVACSKKGRIAVAQMRADEGLDFAGLVITARRMGFHAENSKYMIFYGGSDDDSCGIGQLMPDDRPGVENANNNTHPMYASVWRQCWSGGAPLHEVTHMMGGVQSSAPSSTGAAHCNDGLDVMCYADGGPRSQQRRVCRDVRYDCNGNDYFDPTPRGYLANHWNVGHPMNLYLEFR